jgi:hypothetical protein
MLPALGLDVEFQSQRINYCMQISLSWADFSCGTVFKKVLIFYFIILLCIIESPNAY